MTNLVDGWAAMAAVAAEALEPDPDMTVDAWADEYAFIPADTGANEHGKYRTSRTPHARLVMQLLSGNNPCKRVVLMGASQMLKTQVALNFFCSTVHQAPSNFLWIVPTGTLVKRASGRIDKTIKATDVVAEKVAAKRSRDSTNNLTTKEYLGGTLHVLTAGAAANLSEVSARYIVYDEIDRSDSNIQGEGSPSALAEARQTTFEQNRKAYYPSSPTIEDESPIAALFAQGTQREALAECIHCGHAQQLDFFRLMRSSDGLQALYPCAECGGLHVEADKERMFRNGLWSAGVAGDGETESLTISQMFLPYGWYPWIGLLNKYAAAKTKMDAGDDAEMIVFYNTRLARCWARVKEQAQWTELRDRAEPYRLGTVPPGASVLTCSVDCQHTYLQYKVVGWGEGMEWWVVDRGRIDGSPTDAATWLLLDELLSSRFRHAYGQMLTISATFIDSGGSDGTTQEVYDFCYPRRRRNIFPCKGASKPNRPIIAAKPSLVDMSQRGKTEKRGGQLWMVGADTAKDYLAARYKKTEGPGAAHFSDQLPEDYFRQLTAEYITYAFKRGRKVRVWEKKNSDRNEDGDLAVYNLAAAHFLQLHKKTAHQWKLLRDRLNVATLALFPDPPASDPATEPPAVIPAALVHPVVVAVRDQRVPSFPTTAQNSAPVSPFASTEWSSRL